MNDFLERRRTEAEQEYSLLLDNTDGASDEVCDAAKLAEAYALVMEDIRKVSPTISDTLDMLVPEDGDPTLPSCGELHAMNITDMTAPYARGKRLAFRMVAATCPAVDAAFDDAFSEVMVEHQRTPEDEPALDAIFCKLRHRIKEIGTHPLRRALIYVCEHWKGDE
jgi:hypothetical protein